jgi:hypothetical protein
MNCLEYFDTHYSDDLEEELEIRFNFIDHDPSVGVYYDFEWEALDEKGVDRRDDLEMSEQDEIERLIYKHIKENLGKATEDFY